MTISQDPAVAQILRDIALLRARGYFEAFFDEYQRASCQREAWAQVEARLYAVFHVRRYTTFEAFKKALRHSKELVRREEARYLGAD